MVAHKYKVGQTLHFSQSRAGMQADSRVCKIVKLLPEEGGQPQYRIKCTSEVVERVVKESVLSRSE